MYKSNGKDMLPDVKTFTGSAGDIFDHYFAGGKLMVDEDIGI